MTVAKKLKNPTSKAEFDLPGKTKVQKHRAKCIYDALVKCYPEAHCELDYANAHELLIATILSAQTTDTNVNKATPKLFAAFKTPEDYAASTPEEIEPYVRSLGFFRNKANAVHSSMSAIAHDFDSKVPNTMEELLSLRGVARKTANVVLGNAFKINVGVVVDTHVLRLSKRLALTMHEDVKKIELDLMALFARPNWTMLSHLLIWHGRRACKARGALCAENTLCNKFCSNAKNVLH